MGYFPIIKELSFRSLSKAVDDLLRKRAQKRFRDTFKLYRKAEKKLEKLFGSKLILLEENCTNSDLNACKAFFKGNTKKLSVCRRKSPIPEEEDMVILISTSRQLWNRRGILSDDTHFTDYKDEIYREYEVEVIPMKELNQIMVSWKWK